MVLPRMLVPRSYLLVVEHRSPTSLPALGRDFCLLPADDRVVNEPTPALSETVSRSRPLLQRLETCGPRLRPFATNMIAWRRFTTGDGGITSRSRYGPSWNVSLSRDKNMSLTSPAVQVNWNTSCFLDCLVCEL